MGKWSQVRCNCRNRIPLPKSSWYDQPHRHRTHKKLSQKQRREIEAWSKNVEDMYECGHRNGMLVQLCPNEIIQLGFVLKKVFKNDSLSFEIYLRVGDWRNYFCQNLNEELHISPQDAQLWLMEATELEQAFLGYGNIPYEKVQQITLILYQRKIKSYYDLKLSLKSSTEKGFDRIMPLLANLDDDLISPHSIIENFFSVIKDTTRLCKAGINSGNPIELFW